MIDELRRLGFKKIFMIPIVAGMRGWHPQMCSESLRKLHIRPARIDKLLKSYTQTAWKYARAIVGTRRRLEASEEYKMRSGLHATKNNKRSARARQWANRAQGGFG